MRHYARWAFALSLLPLAACTGREKPMPAPVPPPPKLSSADTAFLDQAAAIDLGEIQEGRLAARRGARPTVRQFGQQMVTDHTKNNQTLMSLAQSKGVSVPTAPDQHAMAEMTELEHLHGHAFDRQYVGEQVTGHQQAIGLYQQEAQQGSDPEVKAFAQQTLPILQQHLSMAEALGRGPVRHRRPHHGHSKHM